MKKMIYLVLGLLMSVGNANAVINKESIVGASKELVKKVVAGVAAYKVYDSMQLFDLVEKILNIAKKDPGLKKLNPSEVYRKTLTLAMLMKLVSGYTTYRAVYAAESLLENKANDIQQGVIHSVEVMKKKIKSLEIPRTLKDAASKTKAKSAQAYARVRSIIKKSEVVEAPPAA